MHDTAFHIGTLAMNIYADLRTDAILEVGSQTVNGSLRQNALPTTRYVGLDIVEGEGVDLVVEPGKPFPIDDDSFDLVIASSVFEHDPFFWMTFLEMCRATKDGGYIYINAPSNGVVHRYPQDNWRFYPDSGRALAEWAVSQGTPVTLVESFIAKREKDIWNDFVAVFRKGPIMKALPNVFIHQHLECTDVITWKSKEVINPSDRTEDAILLDDAKDRASAAERQLLEVSAERDVLGNETERLKTLLSNTEQQRQAQLDQAARTRADLSHRDSELRQRQEEIEQTRAELAGVREKLAERTEDLNRRQEELRQTYSELSAARADLAVSKERIEIEADLRRESELALASSENLYKQEQERSAELLEELESEIASVQAELAELKSERTIAESRLNERFREVATMSELLSQAEENERKVREQLEWLCEASSVLLNGSTSLRGRLYRILPAAFESKRQRSLLKRKGLFDAEAYLAAHPDVAEDRVDPLGHYLKHGLIEDRRRS